MTAERILYYQSNGIRVDSADITVRDKTIPISSITLVKRDTTKEKMNHLWWLLGIMFSLVGLSSDIPEIATAGSVGLTASLLLAIYQRTNSTTYHLTVNSADDQTTISDTDKNTIDSIAKSISKSIASIESNRVRTLINREDHPYMYDPTLKSIKSEPPPKTNSESPALPASFTIFNQLNDIPEGKKLTKRIAQKAHPIADLEIVYKDAFDEISTRKISVIRATRENGDYTLECYCHLRKQPRTFLASRIVQCVDLSTGEVINNYTKHLDQITLNHLKKLN